MPTYDKAQPGKPLNIPAAVWNEMLDVLVWARTQRGGNRSTNKPGFRDSDLVDIKNTSGSDRNAFDVLGIDTPLFTSSDNLEEFKYRFALKGVTPDTPDHFGKFCILLAPAKNNEIARAIVGGLAVVQVDVGHAAYTHADVTDSDATKLTAGFFGGVEMLWKETGTGTKWALVRFGNRKGPVLGKTDAAINKAASGTCSVYTGTPGSETDTGANITSVYNKFDNVGSGKWVLIDSIDGKPYLTGKEC